MGGLQPLGRWRVVTELEIAQETTCLQRGRNRKTDRRGVPPVLRDSLCPFGGVARFYHSLPLSSHGGSRKGEVMKTKSELRQAHGTPRQFRAAVLKAVPGMISIKDAQKAIAKYEREYAAASNCLRHRWKVQSFDETTGKGVWACKCGATRTRQARFLCQ